jgi:hypothetical protein
MAVKTEKRMYGPPSSTIAFDQIFHQTRDPLSVINSCMSFSEESWDFICENIECPRSAPIEIRAGTYWLLWNEKVENIATWRYCIEDFTQRVFAEFCDRLGIRCNRIVVESIPRDLNTRKNGRRFHLIEEGFRRVGFGVPNLIRPAIARTQGGDAITWSALENSDPRLCAKIQAKAVQYGYGLDEQRGAERRSDSNYTKTLSGSPSI